MEDVVRFLVIDPWPLIVENLFSGHTVRIVTHGPVSGFGTSKTGKERFMDPVCEIIAPKVAKLSLLYALNAFSHLV